MAIASLIIGIFIILSVFPAGGGMPIRLIGIIGLVLAILALRKKTKRRIAIVGLALNSLAILFFITQLILLATGT